MKNTKILPLVYVLLLIFTESCFLRKNIEGNGVEQPISRNAIIDEDNYIKYFTTFSEASKYVALDDSEKATEKYLKCLDILPQKSAPYYFLAEIYYKQKEYSQAAQKIEKAVEMQADNRWYRVLAIDIYKATSNNGDAIKHNKELLTIAPKNIKYHYNLIDLYIIENKYDKAIDSYNDIENAFGYSTTIGQERSKIYKLQNKKDKAEDELKRMINKWPDKPEFLLQLAQLYSDNNREEDAFDIYNKVVAIDSTNANAHYLLAGYYQKNGQFDNAAKELKLVFSNPDVSLQKKLQFIEKNKKAAAQNQRLKVQAYELLDMLEKNYPQDLRVAAVYADYLIADKMWDKAELQLERYIKENKQDFKGWMRYISVCHKQKKYEKITLICEEALTYYPNQPRLYLAAGLSYERLKKVDAAIEYLENANAILVGDDELSVDINFKLGILYDKKKQYSKSDICFEEVLKVDANHKKTLNTYSYNLALRNEKLDKALSMIELCTSKASNNPYFLDTHAWVLFKMEKYKEAEDKIQQAIKNKGDKNAVIIEHYVAILKALGKNDEAATQEEHLKLLKSKKNEENNK